VRSQLHITLAAQQHARRQPAVLGQLLTSACREQGRQASREAGAQTAQLKVLLAKEKQETSTAV
jgi:hypothetical protein